MDKKRILVIDDEPGVCASIELVLEDDYQVTIVHTAQEGLIVLAEHQPDLVLLDIQLPDMDGVTALEKIKNHYPQLKVAIVTACRAEEVPQRAQELGVDDYLIKPFEIKDLKERVARLLA